MTNFPTLRIGVLTSLVELRKQFEHNPLVFQSEECPYDKETILALNEIFRERVVEKTIEVQKVVQVAPEREGIKMSLSEQEEVAESARDLLKQLQELGEGEKGLDTQTKIQIIKTKAALVEQLIKQRERWLNVKRLSAFQAVVIGVLDDLVGEDQRSEFLKRIEPYRE